MVRTFALILLGAGLGLGLGFHLWGEAPAERPGAMCPALTEIPTDNPPMVCGDIRVPWVGECAYFPNEFPGQPGDKNGDGYVGVKRGSEAFALMCDAINMVAQEQSSGFEPLSNGSIVFDPMDVEGLKNAPEELQKMAADIRQAHEKGFTKDGTTVIKLDNGEELTITSETLDPVDLGCEDPCDPKCVDAMADFLINGFPDGPPSK